MFMNFRVIILLFLLITIRHVDAQIGITNNAPNNDPNHLINNILIGGGVTVSNIQFSGNNSVGTVLMKKKERGLCKH